MQSMVGAIKQLKPFACVMAVATIIPTLFPGIATADNNAHLAVTAVVRPSATITLTDSTGPASTLTFSGTDSSAVTASEGTITVMAAVSTTSGNTDTFIQVQGTDLTGDKPSDVIAASNISFVQSAGIGGATWLSGSLSNAWTTLAKLTSGSGVYSGEQTYTLKIPNSANDDTYHGTITYQIFGF
jgi:hypothetical protein